MDDSGSPGRHAAGMSRSASPRRAPSGAAEPSPFDDSASLWQYQAYEWGAGGLLLTLILQTTDAPGADRAGLYAICAMAYVCVFVMLAFRARLPVVLIQPTLLMGYVLISFVIYFSHDVDTFFAMYYVWLNVYAFYFLRPRWGWAHTAFALVLYAITLRVLEPSPPLTPWLMTAGTLVVVGSMVVSLRGRVDRLVAELAEAARRDPLTGLLNRRGFDERIASEIQRAGRTGRPFSLIVADIDHFKRVNDRGGHSAGDEVLRRVAALLQAGKRRIDSAARLGGEEFVLLVPETDAAGALVLAERLRAQVRADFAQDPQPITMSFGIAGFPADGEEDGDLLLAADEAVFAAKHGGRDRSVLYAGRLASPPHTAATQQHSEVRSSGPPSPAP